MKTALKPQIMPVMLMLLGLSLSGCLWMMAPMLATGAGQSKAKETKAEEADWTFWKRLETADTPQKQYAIAKSYRQDAEDYRLQAKEHQRRKTVYESYGSKPWGDEATAEFMVIHCQRLVEKFAELADEMESLAQEHEMTAEKIAREQKKDTE